MLFIVANSDVIEDLHLFSVSRPSSSSVLFPWDQLFISWVYAGLGYAG